MKILKVMSRGKAMASRVLYFVKDIDIEHKLIVALNGTHVLEGVYQAVQWCQYKVFG